MCFRAFTGYRTVQLRNCIAKMSSITPEEYTQVIKVDDVLQFCVRCMEKVGTSKSHSLALGNVLVAGDRRGHYSHGLNRLEMYVVDIQQGVTNIKDEPEIEKETVSTALVNGKHLPGPVVGKFCMELAIHKAKNTGIAYVAASASNHYGIAGWYSILAAEAGLLGMSLTNSSPLVYPSRSKQKSLGTNPLTLAAPSSKPNDDFVLDMATSAVALGKIEMCRRRGLPIPHGWAANKDGKSTTDATVAATDGALFPLGGEEHTSGYKGYGLGLLVEILTGILSNATYGPNIRPWMSTERVADLGQCFIAIDPKAFAPGFGDRLADYLDTMRNLKRADESKPVLVPGDPERAHIAECEKLGGIRYPPVLIDSMNNFADRLQVERMPVMRDLGK